MKLLLKIKNFFQHARIRKQLNLIYLTALSIPVLIIGLFLILNTKSLLLKHYQNQVEADNIRVKSIMFDVTTTVYNISDEIFIDKGLQTLLSGSYTGTLDATKNSSAYYTRLSNYITKNTFISSIEIYTTNPTLTAYASIRPATQEIQAAEWYQRALGRADILWESLERVDGFKHTTQELCLLRRIPVISTGEYAVLVIRVSNVYLKNRIQYNELYNTVTVNEDPVFFSTERNLAGNALPVAIDYEKPQYTYSGELDYKGTRGIAHISTLLPNLSKDKIYITTLDFDGLPALTKIIMTSAAIIILASVLPFFMIMSFTNKFSARVITLRAEMHKASSGDYDIIDSFNGTDELTEAFTDLKGMIASIKQMDARMYEAKIQEQELKNQQQKMEFKMLASQINPHFLYNTLETIRMKALTEGNRDVANAIKLLGKSMHYVLENTGTASTTLKRELDYIATYLAIQKLRFNDRVNYTLHIPDELDTDRYEILPLLLQPIVENAILHGLEGIETDGRIVIDVGTRDQDALLIRISDNGLGMTEDALARLMANLDKRERKSTNSIGLYNINQRIKLFYGEDYGMTITSRPGEGTQVCLTLPLLNTMEE